MGDGILSQKVGELSLSLLGPASREGCGLADRAHGPETLRCRRRGPSDQRKRDPHAKSLRSEGDEGEGLQDLVAKSALMATVTRPIRCVMSSKRPDDKLSALTEEITMNGQKSERLRLEQRKTALLTSPPAAAASYDKHRIRATRRPRTERFSTVNLHSPTHALSFR